MSQQQTATRFFIAVNADAQSDCKIWGLGLSSEAAVADAHKGSGTEDPVISMEDGDEQTWTVTYGPGQTREFSTESAAEAFAEECGFKALECTERLYRFAEQDDPTSWTRDAAGLEDLDVDQELVDAAVAEVERGLDGCTAQADWKIEAALQDAHAYVDAYVLDDEGVDEDLQDAIRDDRQLRTAIDVAVKSLILDEIAEREAVTHKHGMEMLGANDLARRYENRRD